MAAFLQLKYHHSLSREHVFLETSPVTATNNGKNSAPNMFYSVGALLRRRPNADEVS